MRIRRAETGNLAFVQRQRRSTNQRNRLRLLLAFAARIKKPHAVEVIGDRTSVIA